MGAAGKALTRADCCPEHLVGFSQHVPTAWHGWAELAGPSSQEEPMRAELGMEGTGGAERTRDTARRRAREMEVRGSREGCPHVTTPGPPPAWKQAAPRMSCLAELLSVHPLRHAAASPACPASAVVAPERKTPRAMQQVAQRQRCLMVPAQTPGQGPRSPGAPFTPCPPSRTPTPCNTQPVCPAGEAEGALSWHRVIGDRTAQGSSNRDSMSEETLASPCPIHTFAERAAPC